MLQSPLLSPYFAGRSVWNNLTEVITAMLLTKSSLRLKSNGHKYFMYGIREGRDIDDRHLRALKLYTDYTNLCIAFCSILRRGDPEEVAHIANWARHLTETVQCFGSPLSADVADRIYYRGIDKPFIFMTIVSRFNLPLSTTTKVS